jgi:hypothetical protein
MATAAEIAGLVSPIGEQPEEPAEACPTLSWPQRLIGFAGFSLFGLFLMIMSWLQWPDLLVNPSRWAFTYTLGNVCTLGSTMFLVGPTTQWKKMFEQHRFQASAVYLCSLLATIVACVWLKKLAWSGVLIGCLVIVQGCALFWYTISYIPYARQCITKCCGSWCAF